MTDHTIEAAYERLTTSIAAPTDADRLVAARVATRRRRRRTTQGAVALLGAGAVVAGVALVGGGGGSVAPQRPAFATDTTSSVAPRTDASEAASTLVGDDCPILELRELAEHPQTIAEVRDQIAELRRMARDPQERRALMAACGVT